MGTYYSLDTIFVGGGEGVCENGAGDCRYIGLRLEFKSMVGWLGPGEGWYFSGAVGDFGILSGGELG